MANILGARFDRLTEAQVVDHVMQALARGQGGWIVTPNLDILRLMSNDPRLARFLQQADLVVADGMPVVWASRLLGDALPERVAGSSLISTLSEAGAENGRSVYLLGGNEGAASGAANVLRSRHPQLRLVGIHCPPMGFDQDDSYRYRLCDEIRQAAPDIVFVALGCPKQERVIAAIRSAAPSAWYVGVGISFSYLSGDVARAPDWMRRMGLEWVFRLHQEPTRLARRYLRDDVPFALRLAGRCLQARLLGRWTRRTSTPLVRG